MADIGDLEVFKKKGDRGRRSKPAAILLQRKGTITINPKAHQMIGSPDAVVLLYARKERMIGIRAADPSVPYAYPARRMKGALARVVSGKGFMNHYDITVSDLMELPVTLDDNTLVAQLP